MAGLMAGVVWVGFVVVEVEVVEGISDEEDVFEIEDEDEGRVKDEDLDELVKVDSVELDDAFAVVETEELDNEDDVANFVDELEPKTLLLEVVLKIF